MVAAQIKEACPGSCRQKVAVLGSTPDSLDAERVKHGHLRLEVLVDEDVIAVELKAVLVADDDLLHALQALDEDVIHVTEEPLHCLGPVFGCQVLPETLQHPLAALWQGSHDGKENPHLARGPLPAENPGSHLPHPEARTN